MQSTYRNIAYRLLPETEETASKLSGQSGARRFVWNHFLARNRYEMKRHKCCPEICLKPSISFFSLGKELTKLRKETEWLNEYSFSIARHVLKHYQDAWKKCFAIEGSRGFPKFKSRYGQEPSFAIPDNIHIKDGRLAIPKIGRLRMQRKGDNPYENGIAKSAVIKRKCGKWYAIVCYEVLLPEQPDNGIVAGIDRNVNQAAVVDSVGKAEIHYLPELRTLEAKKKRCQRMMAKRQKPNYKKEIKASKRYLKVKHRVAKIDNEIANIRPNWQHRISAKVSTQASTVIVENPNTKGMTTSAKGTVEEPGKNVKAKSGLNREILNTGWSGLEQKIQYKSKHLIKINSAYTSQTCHVCNSVDKANRKGRNFKCVACGHADHADLNAARNIMAAGMVASGRGEAMSLDTSMSRQKAYIAA